MKRWLLTIIIFIPISLFSVENRLVKRYAILVGANNGGDERAVLRYAESDAEVISSVFSELGGIENSDSILLLNPTKSSIERSFTKVKSRILRDDETTRTEIIFYYSGHSTEEGLLIRNELYTYKDLKHSLEETDADVKIGILDSCSSGAFTLLKGGTHTAPFLVDESIKTSGHAFITSASEDEAAQESNILQASFFTHFLVSALRGAADSSRDGKVTLHEAYSYASNETLARTEVTQAGAQHASYDFRLSGSGDIVLTDLRDAASGLEFSDEDFGRFFIRDVEDNLISEVNKKYGSKLKISIPSSKYTIIKQVDDNYYKQTLDIHNGETGLLNIDDYVEYMPERNVVRGGKSNQIEYDLNVPEATAIFGWTDNEKERDVRTDVGLVSKAGSLEGLQLSFANMVTNDAAGGQFGVLYNLAGGDFSGIQMSGLFNIAAGNVEHHGIQTSLLYNRIEQGSDGFTLQLTGLFNTLGADTEAPLVQVAPIFNHIGGNTHDFTSQTALIYNSTNNYSGIQLAGIYNKTADFEGYQFGGLFNSSENISGVQSSSLFNDANDLTGLQTSILFNKANDVKGAQLSLVNIADVVYGTQIGIVNINKDIKGVPIGLINVSTDGIKNFSYRYDSTNQDHYLDYQFGSSIIYHLFYLGLVNQSSDIYLGAGLGCHIPIGSFYSEFDISLKNLFNYDITDGYTYDAGYPQLTGKLGFPLYKDIAPYAGISLTFPEILNENLDLTTEVFELEDTKASLFFGVRF